MNIKKIISLFQNTASSCYPQLIASKSELKKRKCSVSFNEPQKTPSVKSAKNGIIRMVLPPKKESPLTLRITQELLHSSDICPNFPIPYSLVKKPNSSQELQMSSDLTIKYWDEQEFFEGDSLAGAAIQRWAEFISKFTPVKHSQEQPHFDAQFNHIENAYFHCYLDVPTAKQSSQTEQKQTYENLEILITFEHHSQNTETFSDVAPSWAESKHNREKLHPIITISEWNNKEELLKNQEVENPPEYLLKLRLDTDLNCCELVSLKKGRLLSGNKLMELSAKITQLLGIRRTTLHDASIIGLPAPKNDGTKKNHQTNEIELSLRQILSLKDGASWYERYGFKIIPCRNAQGPRYKNIYQDPTFYSLSLDRIRKTPIHWVKEVYLPWLLTHGIIKKNEVSKLNNLLSQKELNPKASISDLVQITHDKLKTDYTNKSFWLDMSLVLHALLTHNELRLSTIPESILNFNLALDIFHSHVLFIKEVLPSPIPHEENASFSIISKIPSLESLKYSPKGLSNLWSNSTTNPMDNMSSQRKNRTSETSSEASSEFTDPGIYEKESTPSKFDIAINELKSTSNCSHKNWKSMRHNLKPI
jgi:hypothetical protein